MGTTVTPLGPTEAGPSHSVQRIRAQWGQRLARFKQASLAVQVSHRGRYSIERLLALEEYTRSTSLARVVLVCVGTPLPIVILVISQEALPLGNPADGWRANWGFWVRAAILGGMVSYGISTKLKHLVEGIEVSLSQLALQQASVAISYMAASILVASLSVFPIPFMAIVMTPTFMVLLASSWRIIYGRATFRQILKNRDQLQRFVKVTSVQLLMAVMYPGYQVLFNAISGSVYELPAFLMLPVIKMVLKNLVSFCFADLHDMIPENIIFTVHFFNAVYLATCMQSASSTFAVATIMIIDFLETGFALNGIYRSSTRIMIQLHRTIGSASASDNLLTAAWSLCHHHDKFTKEERSQVQVRSCLRSKLSATGRGLLDHLDKSALKLGPSFARPSNSQSMPAIERVESATMDLSRFRVLFSEQWSTMVQPISPIKAVHVKLARGEKTRNKISAVAAIPSVQHIASLRKTLATLFTIECIVLSEYVEFIIPLLYGNYVLMMVHLPSARYHTELTGLTPENVDPTVQTVFVYGLLELGSFILLLVVMRRSCGIQALYHLAFVLENQMLSIQCQIMCWMLITLGFRVVHFGTFTADAAVEGLTSRSSFRG
ncbi:hypothetical protein PHYPSEUDO_012889 [Phytophthora pseudosyringae]|uniref:Transmembrane protein n=1 Tax=Phytophthora pseudosyringae TaxID=221518 RepID=A0A8T1W4J2_9STRA|nr:hypothetical protein PHYPSEUDO_012889 [Phytophthora pseudosyringae]